MTATETTHRLSLADTAQLLAQLTGVNGADARTIVLASARWPKDSLPEDGSDVGPIGRRQAPGSVDAVEVDFVALSNSITAAFSCPVDDAQRVAATLIEGAAAPSDETPALAWRNAVFHQEEVQPSKSPHRKQAT